MGMGEGNYTVVEGVYYEEGRFLEVSGWLLFLTRLNIGL
jgi:hypothetical protein